eukprot:gene4229-3297_t
MPLGKEDPAATSAHHDGNRLNSSTIRGHAPEALHPIQLGEMEHYDGKYRK